MVKQASTKSLFIVSSIANEDRRQKYVYELLHAAEHARLAHEYGVLEQVVKGICEVQLSHHEQEAANYYSGLMSLVKGSPAKAKKLLESAAERGDNCFRARALTGLAAIQARTGDLRLAEEFYSESYLVSSRSDRDYRLGWYVYKDRCVLRSLAGDHKGAEKLLEEGLPAARMIGLHHPGFFLDWLNSLAVEKLELKKADEATTIMQPLKYSPLLPNFPTWQDTLMELDEHRCAPSRSVVAVSEIATENRILDFCKYVKNRSTIKPFANTLSRDRRLKLITHLLSQYPMSLTLRRIIVKIVDDDGTKSDILHSILRLL